MGQDLRLADSAIDGRAHVVEVAGEVDLYSAPDLHDTATRVIEDGATHVVVDLTRVSFIDSSGLGVLVGILKRLRRESGTLSLVITDYDLERTLELSGLDRTFAIYRSRGEALAQSTNA